MEIDNLFASAFLSLLETLLNVFVILTLVLLSIYLYSNLCISIAIINFFCYIVIGLWAINFIIGAIFSLIGYFDEGFEPNFGFFWSLIFNILFITLIILTFVFFGRLKEILQFVQTPTILMVIAILVCIKTTLETIINIPVDFIETCKDNSGVHL